LKRARLARVPARCHIVGMVTAKVPGKLKPEGTPHDFVTVARHVVEQAIGERLDGSPLPRRTPRRAVGGAKGGRTRAKNLTPEQRSDIAHVAAAARWKK